jgi:putative MFS transporter
LQRAPNRGLELATLVSGLLFCGVTAVHAFQQLRLDVLLPDDPLAYQQAAARGDAFVSSVLLLLGFVVLVLCLFDAARSASLRGRRPALRAASILCVVGLAWLSAAYLDAGPIDPTLGGEALLAQHRAQAPAYVALYALVLTLAACLAAAQRAPGPEPPEVDAEGRYPSPWVPPLFGKTPRLPERQWRVLGLMVAAGLFNAYDHQIFSLALKQIQEGLGIDDARLGYLGSVVRLGVIPGVLLVLLGDVLGRRRLLLGTIAGYTLSTGLTAFAPDEQTFVACQFLSRTFGAAETTLAAVVVTEEIDAEHRGWALGVLAGLAFLGVALAWVLFASVEVFPLGWRGLYLVGLGPLLLLAWLRRRLPETQRFERQRERAPRRGVLASVVRPLANLVRMYPRRFAAVAAVGFLMSFSGQSAGFFFPKYMQDSHGIAPGRLTLLAAGVGIAGMCAMPLLGRLGDRVGRKPVALLFIALNPLAVMGVFLGSGIAWLAVFFLLMFLTDIGSDHNLRVFAKELFPTSHRATAGAAAALLGQLGGSLGLAAESVLFGVLGSHGQAVSVLAAVGFVVPLLVYRAYPETRRRVLEDIAPERDRL